MHINLHFACKELNYNICTPNSFETLPKSWLSAVQTGWRYSEIIVNTLNSFEHREPGVVESFKWVWHSLMLPNLLEPLFNADNTSLGRISNEFAVVQCLQTRLNPCLLWFNAPNPILCRNPSLGESFKWVWGVFELLAQLFENWMYNNRIAQTQYIHY